MWNFRPSALRGKNYAGSTVDDLLECYHQDNERAAREKVSIPPRKSTASSSSSSSSSLRTCQWNVHCFEPYKLHHPEDLPRSIVETLLQVQADIIVLNEFGILLDCLPNQEPERDFVRQQLESNGYTIHTADCGCPTAIASKLPVLATSKFSLDFTRACVGVQIKLRVNANNKQENDPENNEEEDNVEFWVYGTHLEDCDANNGRLRLSEMRNLLEHTAGKHVAMIIGDFNQQRQQDYTPQEWQQIVASKRRRNSPLDDGVASLLQQAGYTCIWDQVAGKNHENNNNSSVVVDTNWGNSLSNSFGTSSTTAATQMATRNRQSPPPSTHWSGTVVDYCYYYQNQPLQLKGVYVSPSDLSDHRLVVCDWDLVHPGPKK